MCGYCENIDGDSTTLYEEEYRCRLGMDECNLTSELKIKRFENNEEVSLWLDVRLGDIQLVSDCVAIKHCPICGRKFN